MSASSVKQNGSVCLPYFPPPVIYYRLMFFWQFNSEWYWTQEECGTGECDCCHATEVGCQKASKSREKATSHQSPTYHWMAPFIVSISSAASSHNTTRWISVAFLIDMFSSSSLSSFFILTVPFSSPHQNDGFSKRSCHIPRTQPCTRHLFTPENEVCDESQLPLRKLAVDSHLISLPWVDNCNAPQSHLSLWC